MLASHSAYSVLTFTLRGIPFLNTLREDWVEFFLIKLPKTEIPLVARASEIWGQYLEDIHSTIHETAPEILPYLEAIHPNLQNILCELCESISSTIKSISKCASRIHPLFITSLRSGLAPIFYQALEIEDKFKKHYFLSAFSASFHLHSSFTIAT